MIGLLLAGATLGLLAPIKLEIAQVITSVNNETFILPVNDLYRSVLVSRSYVEQFRPLPGGFYIVGKDGRQTYLPPPQ